MPFVEFGSELKLEKFFSNFFFWLNIPIHSRWDALKALCPCAGRTPSTRRVAVCRSSLWFPSSFSFCGPESETQNEALRFFYFEFGFSKKCPDSLGSLSPNFWHIAMDNPGHSFEVNWPYLSLFEFRIQKFGLWSQKDFHSFCKLLVRFLDSTGCRTYTVNSETAK